MIRTSPQFGSRQRKDANPRNSFVAQFIGKNNRLSGTVSGLTGALCEVELDGGGSLKALPVNVGEVGSRTQLSVRPERVAIDGEAGSDANRLDARIEELIYQGDTTRVRLRLTCGVDDFVVKLTNTRRQELLPVDAPVSVVFSAEDCRALDEPRPLGGDLGGKTR
jgi:putative spermidine/putrescine transport system ATP-binding protein